MGQTAAGIGSVLQLVSLRTQGRLAQGAHLSVRENDRYVLRERTAKNMEAARVLSQSPDRRDRERSEAPT